MLKKFICLCFCILLCVSVVVNAENGSEITDFELSVGAKAHDGKVGTYVTTNSLTVTGISGAKHIYLTFWDTAPVVTVCVDGKEIKNENKFLQNFITLPSTVTDKIEITFDSTVKLSEIRVFLDGEIPADVHIWSPPVEKADLLLVATHSDDDQLFFAGLLPYYAGEKKYAVQVAYFIDHNQNVARRHELLNGLWTVGVTAYPVISDFPDEYSESGKEALNNFKKHGISEEDAVNWQKDLIIRFKPLVVVGHDLKGEYGHGQHIFNAETLIKGIEAAADTHSIKKLYLHLYNENKITMDYDIPLENFGGKTAFEVSKQGFECHKTQHQYWFYEWLNKREKAADITSYSPCEFGLYKTTVGPDIKGGDMFENVTVYGQQVTIKPSPDGIQTLPTTSEQKAVAKKNDIKIILTSIMPIVIIIAAVIFKILIKKKYKH